MLMSSRFYRATQLELAAPLSVYAINPDPTPWQAIAGSEPPPVQLIDYLHPRETLPVSQFHDEASDFQLRRVRDQLSTIHSHPIWANRVSKIIWASSLLLSSKYAGSSEST
jgi:hypothetical protein